MSEFDELIARIDAVAADLDDLAFTRLNEAVASRATVRPESDKRMMQARRALEKAAHALRAIDATGDDLSGDV